MGSITFIHPWYLLCLPVALVVLYGLTLRRLTRTRSRVISFILRGLAVLSLLAVLSGLEIKATSPNLCRIYLLDNSGSIFLDQTAVLDAIHKNIRSLKPLDRVGLVVFGREALIEVMPVPISEFPVRDTLSARVNPLRTDLGSALLLALNTFPSGYQKELVLLSDGRSTQGDLRSVQAELLKQGVTVFVRPIGPSGLRDIRMVDFHCPPSVAPAEPVEARLILSSTEDTKATVYFYIDGKLQKELNEVALPRAKQTYLTVQLPPLVNAVQEYEVRVATDLFEESCRENNYGRAVVQRTGPVSILYLSGMPGENNLEKIIDGLSNSENGISPPESPLNGQTGGASWQTTTLPAGSTALRNLSLYDLLVLDNVPVYVFEKNDLARIKNFVGTNGGGCLMLGGPDSFALGGYRDSVLEEISPVWAAPKHNIALGLVLDKSGSMAENAAENKTRFQVMREALGEILPLLDKNDQLLVVLFSEDFEVAYPLQPVRPGLIRQTLNERLKKVSPLGATVILAPITKQTLPDLKKATAERKHIILLSDGESTGGEVLKDFQATARQLTEAGITISVLATGTQVNETFLQALCQDQKGGRFYRIADINRLRDFLRQDLAFHKELVKEDENIKIRIIHSEDVLKDIGRLPDLQGYQRTSLKERARLLGATSDNDPILAAWQYGQGKVLAFTSSLDYSWGRPWRDWTDSAKLWGQTLRWLTPVIKNNEDIKINTSVQNNQRIKIVIQSEKFDADQGFQVTITSAGREKSVLEIPPVSAGRFELVTSPFPAGVYFISVAGSDNIGFVKRLAVVIPYSVEWQRFEPDLPKLKNLAVGTGGRLVRSLSQIRSSSRPLPEMSQTNQKIDWFFIGLALFFILGDFFLQTPLFRSKM